MKILLFSMAACPLLGLGCSHDQDMIQGRPVAAWVDEVEISGVFLSPAAQVLKDAGAPVMPRLERLLCESKSPQEQAKTAFAMSGICYRNANAPEVLHAVPILTASARNKDTEVRIYSIQALAAIGKAAHKATADLVQLTRDKDAGVRMCAVEALGRIGAHSRGSLVALRIATSDTNDGVRLTAVKALELVQSNHK